MSFLPSPGSQSTYYLPFLSLLVQILFLIFYRVILISIAVKHASCGQIFLSVFSKPSLIWKQCKTVKSWLLKFWMYGEHVCDMTVLPLFLDSDTREGSFQGPLPAVLWSKAQLKAKTKGQLEIKFYLHSSHWESNQERMKQARNRFARKKWQLGNLTSSYKPKCPRPDLGSWWLPSKSPEKKVRKQSSNPPLSHQPLHLNHGQPLSISLSLFRKGKLSLF